MAAYNCIFTGGSIKGCYAAVMKYFSNVSLQRKNVHVIKKVL